DTAVRLAGLRPARVKELEESTRLMRALLDGEDAEVGAAWPARLPHHRPVPIWIAAGGPRTLRMAGGVADGVFIRVGTHPANIARSIKAIRAAADGVCLRGGPAGIIAQLLDVIRSPPVAFDYIVLHPVPNPVMPDDPERGYMARVAREILPAVRSALGAQSISERRDVTR